MSDHLSDFALDRLVAGDNLPEASHVTACEVCQTRLRTLQDHAAHARAQVQFARVARAATLNLGEPQPWWRRLWPVVVPAALAASVAFMVMRPPRGPSTVDDDHERTKGAASVSFVRTSRAPSERALDEGEHVTLAVTAPTGASHVAVFSVSRATRKVETVWPSGDEKTAPIPPGGRLAELVVTPGDGTLVAVFFDGPTDVKPVLAALARQTDVRALTLGDLPQGVRSVATREYEVERRGSP